MSQSDNGNTLTTDNFDADGICQPGSENTGRWTSDEHRLFLKGLELHGKGWKQIATLIQTRTVVQIRTHAQKYFQKLSKAQASGTSHLDPATLMSTMDAGKPRPSSVLRNLRSSTIVNTPGEPEERLMSLRNHRNRIRHTSSMTTDTDSSNSDGGSGVGSSDSDGFSGEEEEMGNCVEPCREKPGTVMMIRQEAPRFTVGGGNVGAHGLHEETGYSVDARGSKLTANPQDACTGWSKRRQTPLTSDRFSPTKATKTIATTAVGGAADARALAWEAASSKSHAVGAGGALDEVAMTGTNAATFPAVTTAGNGTAAKRNRSESGSSNSSLGDTIKSLKRTGGSQSTRISPTSVSDIKSFMSFPVPHTERSDVAMHHLPQQLAPSWCTKPHDTWMAGAGLDIGADSSDAGPFRWFIDERSLSAPGAFFQPPVESWSGSDTTDASVCAGPTSDRDNGAIDVGHQTVVPELPVCTNKVDMSPVGAVTYDDIPTSDDVPSKRRRIEPTVPMPVDPQADVAVSDAAIASEVSRHVEADNATGGEGLDITSGLWLDHPQEASPLMYGLGLSAPPVAGLGGGLSLPSLDEDEVLGFLACAENRPSGDIEA